VSCGLEALGVAMSGLGGAGRRWRLGGPWSKDK
jgi:hypothetical protein